MNVFGEVLKIILKIFLPILIIIFVLTLINIINNYRKYGTRIFSSFKKYNKLGKMKALVIDMLIRESHKEILIVDCNENYFYVITNYNVFAIFVFDYNDSLTGSINDKNLICNDKPIINPVLNFIEHTNKLLNQGITIQKIYVNARRDVKINIDGLTEILTLKDFSYKLYQKQHSNIQYTKEKMIIIKRKIEDIINDNN